jgi:hypothetical protein
LQLYSQQGHHMSSLQEFCTQPNPFGKCKHGDTKFWQNKGSLHLLFTKFLPTSHVPFASSKSESKKTYMDCNRVSMFSTNGRFENVCMAKLHLCAMQWMPMKMGHVFVWNVLSPYLQTLKYNYIIHTKTTQLGNQLNNPPKVVTNLTCILVWLSNPPPSMTFAYSRIRAPSSNF